MTQRTVIHNIEEMLAVLPEPARTALGGHPSLEGLLEVVIDLGRPIEARFPHGFEYLTNEPATQDDIKHVTEQIGEFGGDNRAGIERTLHRISAIRTRTGKIVGLTCRLGRAVFGTIDLIRDVVVQGRSIMLLGRPGVGKTTMLREVARVLSDDFGKRVVVVDTSNEIAGDGDIPHPAIGRARRMQVPLPEQQHDVMIEAVENHMPEVIVVDEIGTEGDARAARTIAERGVQLVATAHGNNLDNLLVNPTLSDLIGGIRAVTLSDEEAKRRGTQKTVLERAAPPTFHTLVEILDMDRVAIHHDVASTVDACLLGSPPRPEVRERSVSGEVSVVEPASQSPPVLSTDERAGPLAAQLSALRRTEGITHILPAGVSRSKLEKAIRELRVPATVVSDDVSADMVIALKTQRRQPARGRPLGRPEAQHITVKSNTYGQIYEAVRQLFDIRTTPREDFALREAEHALKHVMTHSEPVELTPQNAYIRRLQHELAAQHALRSDSVGRDPRRRVRISP